ncbi:MAG: hypothetical protein SFV23_15080 [Planctomycetaceae bacterium]|nr:hypothetical protein [Planctomycetaceae bacterium]
MTKHFDAQYVLSLNFSRDICAKFSQNPRLREALQQHREHAWHTLGTFDFLTIHADSDLDSFRERVEALQRNGDNETDLAIGAHRGLLLVPFDDFFDRQDLGYATFVRRIVMHGTLTRQSGRDESREQQEQFRRENPLLIVARFYLSAVAYELESYYEGVLTAIDCTRKLLEDKSRDFRGKHGDDSLPPVADFRFFRTLGSPDIVLVGLPNSPDQLCGIHRYLSEMRRLKLAEVVEVVRKDLIGKREEGGQPRTLLLNAGRNEDFQYPGHAFASVDETWSFRKNWSSNRLPFRYHPEADPVKDRQREIQLGLRLDFRVRLDCGHEPEFIRYLKRHAPAVGISLEDDSCPLYGGLYTISGRFSHLDDFVEAFDKVWFDIEIRSANIIDTITVPAFSVEELDGDQPDDQQMKRLAWQLRPGLQCELDIIEKSIRMWARTFLSSEQCAELLGIVRTFRSCFYHHELTSAARDLLPFFRQLACACSDISLWRAFRDTLEGNIDRFCEDVELLLAHMHRAVRNRLEHRSRHADPTIPNTLSHGASKLINAYSTVYWLAGELFMRSGKPEDNHCVASHLAVCVAAGSEGRVKYEEVFESFRKFVESTRGEPLSVSPLGTDIFDDAQRSDNTLPSGQGWSVPLMLVDVSGLPIFLPEQSFVHALHETAQFSEWLEDPRRAKLRDSLKEWVVSCMVGIIRDVVIIEGLSDPDDSGHLLDSDPDRCRELARNWRNLISDPLSPYRSKVEGIRNSAQLKELDSFITLALGHMWFNRTQASENEPQQNAKSRETPLEFFDFLQETLEDAGLGLDYWQAMVGELQEAPWRTAEPQSLEIAILMPLAIRAFRTNDFNERVRSLRELLLELTGDIGRIGFFSHIAHRLRNQGSKQSREQSRSISELRDLNQMYAVIFDTFTHRIGQMHERPFAESAPLRESVFPSNTYLGDEYEFFLVRWAIAIRLMCPPMPLIEACRSLKPLLSSTSHKLWQFHAGQSHLICQYFL